MKSIKLCIIVSFFYILHFGNTACFADLADDIVLEGDYILSCQYLGALSDPGYGAFNNVYGNPTWVVPGENAIAIMGLEKASRLLGDNTYKDRAELNADYLVRIQDPGDGAWYDQYEYATAVSSEKSLRHTAEVMIAFDKLGNFTTDRYESMKKGAQFILDCQNVSNKGGLDDGLVAGGKNAQGAYHSWRWASDNSFAYQALQATAAWATHAGDLTYAQNIENAAQRILAGIQNNLWVGDHWQRVIDANGNLILAENKSDWISYAPVMLDLPVSQQGVNPEIIGEWIKQTLQTQDGAVVWDDQDHSDRKSPGYSFQAMLVWLDNLQAEYAQDAAFWAENSGLWQKSPDSNGVSGGWIDWVDDTGIAPQWQRFIDTSSYYIMCQGIGDIRAGYDFNPVIPEPSTLVLMLIGLCGVFSPYVFRQKNH
ncbi:MAG: PEP-CTERM sorting domain-containing protein [Candidatus Omnitrophota bacterium]